MRKQMKENTNLKENWKLINFCEFDKYAIKAYCSIHNIDESLNLGDITKVDETKLEDFNMVCGGSPCQDFSIAGKQKGSIWTCDDCKHEYNPLTVHWSKRNMCPECKSNNIEKTRSSLLMEFLRVVKAKKPNFGIYENVKNIVGKKFKDTTFKLFTDELGEYGYSVHWKVLNAKDYGVPQNRERVYLIFIKKELDNGMFEFPKPFDSGLRLKDVLEDEVDEKYYLDNEKTRNLIAQLDYTPTTENKLNQVGNFEKLANPNKKFNDPQTGRVLDAGGICQALDTMQGGNRQPKILQVGNVNPSGKGINGNVFDPEGLSPTITTNKGEGNKIVCEQRTDEGLRFFKNEVCGALRTIDSCGDKRVIESGVRKIGRAHV